MIKLLATAILGLSILGGGATGVPVQQRDVEPQNDILIQTQTENLTSIQWHNNKYSLSNDKDSLKLFEKYSIDIEEAQRSADIYIQEEYVPFKETVSLEYINANSDVHSSDISTPLADGDNNGYIKFITKAYRIGFYEGNTVYHVEVTTEQQKSFLVNKNDHLIIRRGNNSETLIHPSCPAKGKKTTPVTTYVVTKDPLISYEIEELDPNYSCANGGVYYTFKVGGDSYHGDGIAVEYGNTTVTADYYLYATDSTIVQPVYVHNQNLFVNSLSVSFGPIGVGIDVGPLHDVMEGAPISLKGYSDRTHQIVNIMNPEDWGFEGRYYFQNEGLRYTTNTVNDLTISTERLRCGYIEEEYINISPNRIDAGDAYLELKFNKPVYELNTKLSFWSASEGLYAINGDYAYIQYLDVNGNWKTCVDLLAFGLPTNRTAPKDCEYEFVEGTYGIRFVAHKERPTTSWNKGRICIGEIKFITCEII